MNTRREFLRTTMMTGAAALGGGLPAFGAGRGACKLRFGVISDIHFLVGPEAGGFHLKTASMVEQVLRWYDARGVDAVLVTGDIADFGRRAELKKMREVWERVFPGDRGADGRHVERLFITGNHEVMARDYEGYWNEQARDRVWREAFDEPYEDIRVKTVKGYDFVLCGWGHSNAPAGAKKFEETLARCGAGGRLFFQAQHEPPQGTCFGNSSKDSDNGVACALMRKYPNCVAFSGHTHQVLNDERAVWQREFTSIGASSMSCTYVSGGDYPPCGYENGPGAIWDRRLEYAPGVGPAIDAQKCMGYEIGQVSPRRQAMLVSVFDDVLEIVRRDVTDGVDIGEPWQVPYPAKADGPFDPKKRPSLFPLAEFAAGSALTVEPRPVCLRSGAKTPGWMLRVPGGAGTTGGKLMGYEVGYIRKGKYGHVYYAAAMDYNSTRCRAKTTLALSASRVPPDADEIVVRPLDCFGRPGKPLVAKTVFN